MGGNAKDIGIGILTGGLGGLASYAGSHMPSTTLTPAPALPVDPNLENEQKSAEKDKIAALTTQVQGDSASLMARYGTRLAFAGTSSGGPLAAVSPSPFVPFTSGAPLSPVTK